MHTPEFDGAVDDAFARWEEEIGFLPQLIRVEKFNVRGLKIKDRPTHHQQYLADPDGYSPNAEERQQLGRSVEEWDRRGCFVLHWGNSLWMNGDGEIEST